MLLNAHITTLFFRDSEALKKELLSKAGVLPPAEAAQADKSKKTKAATPEPGSCIPPCCLVVALLPLSQSPQVLPQTASHARARMLLHV